MLFGALFDRMVEASTAWRSPYELAQRLGHLDVRKLARMAPAELAVFIGRYRGRPALHRFTSVMAKQVVHASQRLLRDYGGSASNIWPAGARAGLVVERLDAFEGISHKLAHMTVRLLVTYYGVPLTGWEAIDVAVDRHVARVFLRSGLVQGEPGRTTYRVSEIREQVILAARRLRPDHPGAFDEGAFVVGKGWCNAGTAWCADGQGPCPLASVCPQERKSWEIV